VIVVGRDFEDRGSAMNRPEASIAVTARMGRSTPWERACAARARPAPALAWHRFSAAIGEASVVANVRVASISGPRVSVPAGRAVIARQAGATAELRTPVDPVIVALVPLAAAGEEAAFTRLVEAFQPEMARLAYVDDCLEGWLAAGTAAEPTLGPVEPSSARACWSARSWTGSAGAGWTRTVRWPSQTTSRPSSRSWSSTRRPALVLPPERAGSWRIVAPARTVLSCATTRRYLRQQTWSSVMSAGSGRQAGSGLAAGTAKRRLKRGTNRARTRSAASMSAAPASRSSMTSRS